MIKKFKIILSIAVVIVLAFFLRFYNLTSVPPSPSLDEVSIGYNAYSILKTGADEYGTKFPVLLRAYDDWRPALYVYLVIPFVKVFGLNVMAVRLPSVILSVLTVIVFYFLAKELTKNSRLKLEIGKWKLEIPLLAAGLLAISSWHIYLSRLGHEVNAYFAFVIFGGLFFLKAINSSASREFLKLLIISAVFFTLSFYTYQSSKIFVPVILLVLAAISGKKLLLRKKETLIALLAGTILLIPIIRTSLEPNALIRFQGTSAFTSQEERFIKAAIIRAKAIEQNDVIGQIVNNRRIVAGQIFLEGYLANFNPQWLFTNLSADRHKVPNLGLLYIWEAPLIIIGLYFLLKRADWRIKLLILAWILASPLSAAITTDSPHAMRSFTMLPMLILLSAVGIGYIFEKSKNIKILFPAIFSGIIIASIYMLWQNYFGVFPKTQSASFQYALREAVNYVSKHQNLYDKIVFSNRDNLYQSYMFFLFYSTYDPLLYQKQGGTVSAGYAQIHKFDKFEFRPVDLKRERMEEGVLYVVNVSEISNDQPALKIFRNLDGKATIGIAAKEMYEK